MKWHYLNGILGIIVLLIVIIASFLPNPNIVTIVVNGMLAVVNISIFYFCEIIENQKR